MLRGVLIGLLVIAGSLPAAADVLTWKVRSTYPYIVYLEFYSQDRDVAWPGGREVWVLRNSKWHTYRLNCRRGERICYGAWTDTRTSQWGVGEADSMGCRDCCAVCGGAARRITLTD